MGKSTISMAMFNSYVKLPEGKHLRTGSPCKPTTLIEGSRDLDFEHCSSQVSTGEDHQLFKTQGAADFRIFLAGWWFGTCFIFPYIGNNHPN